MGKQQLGQSAFEFLVLAGFLLLLFTILTTLIASNTADLNKNQVAISGDDLVLRIQKEILLAARVSDGYSRNFSLPQKIGTMNYSIIIGNGTEIIVRTSAQDFWRTIPVVQGTPHQGINNIRKQDDIIYIN